MSGRDILETTTEEGMAPDRLDRVLARSFPDISRNRLQVLIREEQVLVDGAVVSDPKRKVGEGVHLQVTVPPAVPAEPERENIPLNVVYEDDDLIVIDKPAGLVVHPGAGHDAGTLVNALLYHCGDSLSGIGGVKRPGIVHRLDKDTSGLMVVAKNDMAHQGLAEQFADHGRTGPLERAYLALVWGKPPQKKGTIETFLARSTQNREKIAVIRPPRHLHEGEDAPTRGRHAITHYHIEDVFPGDDGEPLVSLVRCILETGRTHQIRVHMAHLGHPLLGDTVYGSGFKTKTTKLSPNQQEALEHLNRQALHAAVLGFEHPATGEHLRFESNPPADMQKLINHLQRQE